MKDGKKWKEEKALERTRIPTIFEKVAVHFEGKNLTFDYCVQMKI